MNAKYQINTNGLNWPVWSPDGKQLFYVGPTNKFFVVDIRIEPTFASGKPLELPIAGFIHDFTEPRNFDVTPDGEFIVVMPATQTETKQRPALQINVVLNWFEELKQRVPVH